MVPKNITIFEGPDCCGKTTAAMEYATYINATYIHFDALPDVQEFLVMHYISAIMPALNGFRPVVLDRSWHSEVPYGAVYRGGQYRLDEKDIAMLDILASYGMGVIIHCEIPTELRDSIFTSRQEEELLSSTDMLEDVSVMYQEAYRRYAGLPIHKFDYTAGKSIYEFMDAIDARRFRK